MDLSLLVQEERLDLLQRSEEADDGSTLTSAAVKREDDNGTVETEPVASSSTSTEHMETQADAEKSQPTTDEQLLSSLCYDSDITENSDDWEDAREGPSALNRQQEPHLTQYVDEQAQKLSQDLESSKKTQSMRSRMGKKTFSCTVCGKMFNRKDNLKKHINSYRRKALYLYSLF